MYEELFAGWETHKGSRNAAHTYSDLQVRFRAALGDDFDMSGFITLDQPMALQANCITINGFTAKGKGKDARKNFKKRQLAGKRNEWVGTQRIAPGPAQKILEFESLAQR